jgi:iron(III) transport system substrate-binding protein
MGENVVEHSIKRLVLLAMLALGSALVAIAMLGLAASHAYAAGTVVVYCGVNEEWCRAAAGAFEQKTGVHVDMTRQSAGEIYARLRAEKDNPRGDIWFGGTGDPHLQAADDKLTDPYKPAALSELRDWAQNQAERSHKLTPPACWADLLQPGFKGEVQMADPNASGTAWTMLATIVQLMGEDKAFDYLKRLNRNIDQYTSAGAAPAQAVGRGETMVGVTFQHDMIDAAKTYRDVRVVSPCEGTGYEIGSMSLIHGARHPDEAKQFYNWALMPEAQVLAGQHGSYQIPSNSATLVPPEAPDISKIKLIDYDFAKYGSSAERTRLLTRWTQEVKNAH